MPRDIGYVLTRRFFNSNNIGGSAALAEVCALLSVILVDTVLIDNFVP